MNLQTFKAPLRRLKRKLRNLIEKPDPSRFSEGELLHRLLTTDKQRNAVMIDVGAQFGESFVPFAREGWRVIAFEPDPNPRKQESLAALVGPLVCVRKLAVAEAEQPNAAFFTSGESTGISSLAAFRESHRETAKVQVSTLAREHSGEGLPGIQFLKIDTEGHDLFVLRGFPWLESKLKPRVVLCEFEDSKTVPLGYTWQDMAEFLCAQGYTVFVSEWFPIVQYGVRHKWRTIGHYPISLQDPKAWGNLVAMRDEADAKRFSTWTRSFITA
ncbi:MAG: FkbM family methyltransferase [Lacunisphaera sp.]